jgi:uncharacterized protein YecE (DUF72 family)
MIRVGIGGWTYEPWRGVFYPVGLPQAQELAHASRRVSSIEINSTFYRTQSTASFKKWAGETPDDFMFSVKASRAAVMRGDLAGAGPAIERFTESGLAELGPKLGPLLWQVAPTKKFDAADMTAFLNLLPQKLGKIHLRHALEVRHQSFECDRFRELARARNVALVHVDADGRPDFSAPTADFTYVRLQRAVAEEPTGYAKPALKSWARTVRAWEKSGDVFVYFISAAKERNPAAAEALIALLK